MTSEFKEVMRQIMTDLYDQKIPSAKISKMVMHIMTADDSKGLDGYVKDLYEMADSLKLTDAEFALSFMQALTFEEDKDGNIAVEL